MNFELKFGLMKASGQITACVSAMIALLTSSAFAQEVSFNQDVRPILAGKCFFCHGPDEAHRESGLRLDDHDAAIEHEAIVPGDTNNSGLIERIFSDDDDILMPPPHAKKALSETEKATLKKWIESGAQYDRHWAFVGPTQPAPRLMGDGSESEFHDWPRNEIDHFTLKKMLDAKLEPAPVADKYTLVRRLYQDLIGLPPSIEEADAFVNSTDSDAYEKLVDKLLASDRYGEHWARAWLDLARYSDTNGYEKDRARSIWPFRDWVIKALNNDMPYDQFTIEQLAGDMLENPTADQMIATGFHRNTMLNEEGGIDPLEYRYLAMVDRVSTTGTVWMGLTLGCAQCHTHKYDPITHTDYFSFMALLNNADEPDFLIPDAELASKQKTVKQRIARLEAKLAAEFPPISAGQGSEKDTEVQVDEANQEDPRKKNLDAEFAKWLKLATKQAADWSIIRPVEMETNLPKLEVLSDGSIFSTGDVTKRDQFKLTFDIDEEDLPIHAIRLEAIPDDRLPDRGPGRTYYEGRKGDFFVSEMSAQLNGDDIAFTKASHDYDDPKTDKKWKPNSIFDGDGSSGWMPGPRKGQRLQMVVNLKTPITQPGKLKIEMLFERHYVVSLGRFRFAVTDHPDADAWTTPEDVEQVLVASKTNTDQLSESDLKKLKRQFLLTTPLLAEARKKLTQAKKQLPKQTHTMVMRERASDNVRKTFRHHRGEYLSPKEEVSPGVLSIFKGNSEDEQANQPTNRLELAKWLVSDANPLAGRVAVNRAWRSFFGAGLIRTSGDFGVQSQPPSHPELLDWLAVQFAKDWSVKKLHRLIVTSQTYRQSSLVGSQKRDTDPQNILLTRGPRFRITGEMIRDGALKATGLLKDKMYGPGVYPPQPASVTGLAYGSRPWKHSTGVDRYRRSIYTFNKRTAAFAAYTVFDGPSGEVCTARRNRSNTPLQALTILNDKMFLEMAQAMGSLVESKQFESDPEAISFIFRSILTRPPTEQELNSLVDYFSRQKARLESKELDVEKIGSGANNDVASIESAALTMVVRVVMNLDEAVTKQ